MKRYIAAGLAAVLLCGTCAPAYAADVQSGAAEDAAEEEQTGPVRLSFDTLEETVRENNLSIKSYENTIKSAEETDVDDNYQESLADIEIQIWNYQRQISQLDEAIRNLGNDDNDAALRKSLKAQRASLQTALARLEASYDDTEDQRDDAEADQPKMCIRDSGHTVRAKFTDLCVFDEDMNRIVIAEGDWSFKFNLDFEDTSVSLPAGQTFDLNGMTATIDEITLSPLALRVDYTVDSEVQWDENAQSGKESEHDSEQMHKYFENVQILVNKADGTSIDLSLAGGSISPEDGKTVCQKGDIFSEIVALEDVVSVTVQDVEIPVQQ